jgi:hypothetical protein
MSASIRYTEEEKASRPTEFIFNKATKKWVKRDSVTGRKLIQAEKDGEEFVKPPTETDKLIKLVDTLVEFFGLKDDEVAQALTPIGEILPRTFPQKYGGKGSSPGKIKHPEAPSGKRTANNFFNSEMRKVATEANPGATAGVIMSVLGAMWAQLDESSKKKYHDLAAEDKIRYEKELKAFEEKYPEEARSESPKPRKAEGFTIFSKEMSPKLKEEFPNLAHADIVHLLSAKWAEASKDGTHAKYNEMAKEKNVDFPARIAAFYADPANRKFMTEKEIKNLDDPSLVLNPVSGRFVKKTSVKAKVPTTTTTKPVIPAPVKVEVAEAANAGFDDDDEEIEEE